MKASVTHGQWQHVRASLRETGERFARLVSTCDPDAKATADWTVADTAAHVATLSTMYRAMMEPAGTPHPIPALQDQIPVATVDTVVDFNNVALENFHERDTRVLAKQVRDDIDGILSETDGEDPEKAMPWLGGSEVPLGGVLAHLLNELQIHGRDIADATKSPWKVEPRDAALFFELFLLGVTSYGYGRLLDEKGPAGKPPRAGRIAVEFRSKHTSPVAMLLHDGRVSVEEAGRGIDVHLFFDPVTLNLMLFGRISRLRAGLTGKVVVWGRRPWLLPTFLKTVRLPS